ncbi:MAG: hypothetical protein JO051_02055 [Acidobacteriaceae bacterium]|nr:hypothetical protein [Acidobacteriaceae bacterium]
MGKANRDIPRFASEGDEADWWASRAGRNFVKQKSALRSSGDKGKGSDLVRSLNRKRTTQIALRLPDSDVDRAKEVAARKGIGYQTLLKILLQEALNREATRR